MYVSFALSSISCFCSLLAALMSTSLYHQVTVCLFRVTPVLPGPNPRVNAIFTFEKEVGFSHRFHSFKWTEYRLHLTARCVYGRLGQR